MNFGILLHGGADSNKRRRTRKRAYNKQEEEEILKTIEQAACSGFDVLNHDYNPIINRGKNNNACAAVDAVELAVAIMEDSGVFNAGIIGSCLTSDGAMEMDASIMNGKDLSAGCVGMVQNIQNPIKLARFVMERTDHVMLVSDGVIQLAKLFDIEIKYRRPTELNLKKYSSYMKDNNYNKRMIKKEWPKNHKLLFSSLTKFKFSLNITEQ